MPTSVVNNLGEAIAFISNHQDELQTADYDAIEKLYRHAVGDWSRKLRAVIDRHYDAKHAQNIKNAFADAFSLSFQEAHAPATALEDIAAIERLLQTDAPVVISFAQQENDEHGSFYHLSIYQEGEMISPSRLLRIVENMGLVPVSDQHFTCHVRQGDAVRAVYIHDFPIKIDPHVWEKLVTRNAQFEEAIQAIWRSEAGNDRLNELILCAQLNLHEVVLMRAIGRYLMQLRLPYSQDYYAEMLVRHAPVVRLIVDYFHACFHPGQMDDGRAEKILLKIQQYIAEVKSLDEDRVLRRLLNVVQSTVRTNFYQADADGTAKMQLSLKLRSADVLEMPKPAPLYETFVYANRVEGIHLRSSKIARGGIRWSDRREDFRDEVLDLMRAQTVKNSIIVPTGAKGGFFVKKPPAGGDRAAIQAEAIACYQMFVRGLLDITDNWVGGKIVKPKDVVCRDDDDPYLVVAADKGTASFSDIANALSGEYNFWLGDAFASGGSAGYDHKKMAITARGAWESVRHHGHNLGINVDVAPITIIGVGDMGGDVFGNGLLRSPHVKLIGAFSYSHIFCDPNPDPAKSFAERQRLFDVTGNWDQYNPQLLSKGGRIYSRADKQIELTPEIQACFGLTANSVTPGELMRAMLMAQADLLWFGGIGTYIKASTEQDSDARDKANDFIRISANELRCKIIGEGANLGMTQRARIEAARLGIALNTDFIDNSAGVNSSDYEVNIKILLNQMLLTGSMARDARNALLASMTNDVAEHVLNNNRMQNIALSVAESMSANRVEHYGRLIEELEQASHLDRKLEALPSNTDLQRLIADNMGITRPELSVVLSHSKLLMAHRLAQDPMMQDPILQRLLHSYFPEEIVKRFPEEINRHPLKPQLLAMMLSNRIINQISFYMPKWLKDRTGLGYVEIARAFCVMSKLYDFDTHWMNIYHAAALNADIKRELLVELVQHSDRVLPWFLNQIDLLRDMSGTVDSYSPHYAIIEQNLLSILPPQRRYYRDAHEQRLITAGVQADMAAVHANMRSLAAAPSIIALALDTTRPVLEVARVYFIVGERFGFDDLREKARQSMGGEYWERQAISALIEDFSSHQLRMTQLVMTAGDLQKWETREAQLVGRLDTLMNELRNHPKASVTQLTVANRRLRGLVPGKDR